VGGGFVGGYSELN